MDAITAGSAKLSSRAGLLRGFLPFSKSRTAESETHRPCAAPSWANRRKSKSSLIGGDGDPGEAGGLETGGQRRRVNGNQCVRDVEQAHHPAVRAVHAGKDAAGAEDAADLLEEPVLELDGWHVVEHGEGHRAGKRIVLERQGGAVAAH